MAGTMTVGNDPGQQRSSREGRRPNARLLRRLVEHVRHSADLAELVDFGPRRWNDALLAETRFHLSGMMNAIELAIGLHVLDPDVVAMIGNIGPGYCRQAIEDELGLLSPELLGHLRRRAAMAMLLRGSEVTDRLGDPVALGQVEVNARYAEALTALGIAERRLCGPMMLDAPMRPDLPAEQFHELTWIAAALLIQACERRAEQGASSSLRVIAQAAETLIAQHDEGQGAFALAQRCARSLPRDLRLSLAPAALREARLLLFSALAELETGLPLEQIIDALIDQGNEPRLTVFRLMRIDEAVVFQAAERLAPLTGMAAGGDAALADFLEEYRRFDTAHAESWLLRMSSPRPLMEKLALLDRHR